jgi:hypothetical protein
MYKAWLFYEIRYVVPRKAPMQDMANHVPLEEMIVHNSIIAVGSTWQHGTWEQILKDPFDILFIFSEILDGN